MCVCAWVWVCAYKVCVYGYGCVHYSCVCVFAWVWLCAYMCVCARVWVFAWVLCMGVGVQKCIYA